MVGMESPMTFDQLAIAVAVVMVLVQLLSVWFH
jgi:hypothetical protein